MPQTKFKTVGSRPEEVSGLGPIIKDQIPVAKKKSDDVWKQVAANVNTMKLGSLVFEIGICLVVYLLFMELLDNAHEAMADVEAIIFMAKLVNDRAPEVWDTLIRCSSKQSVIDHFINEEYFAHTAFYFGKPYTWLVTYCGQNPEYSAQLAAFDLRFDPDEYIDLSVDELISVMNASPKVIRAIKANSQPILMPPTSAPENTHGTELDAGELSRRINKIRSEKVFCEKIGEALAGRFADKEPSPYIEERIYDGFPSNDDRQLMEQFHKADWPNKLSIVEKIQDTRIKEFALRLIYVERPDVLPPDKNAEISAWQSRRMLGHDGEVPWMTIPKSLEEVNDLLAVSEGEEAQFLNDVKSYLDNLAAQHMFA
jgi:exodeoxyribonuclease I